MHLLHCRMFCICVVPTALKGLAHVFCWLQVHVPSAESGLLEAMGSGVDADLPAVLLLEVRDTCRGGGGQ